MNKNLKIALIVLGLFLLGIPQFLFRWIRSMTVPVAMTGESNAPYVLSRTATPSGGLWGTPPATTTQVMVSRKPASLWSPNA